MTSKTKKIGAGSYETIDGRFQITKNEMTGFWMLIENATENTSEQWLQDFCTKWEAVEAVDAIRAEEAAETTSEAAERIEAEIAEMGEVTVKSTDADAVAVVEKLVEAGRLEKVGETQQGGYMDLRYMTQEAIAAFDAWEREQARKRQQATDDFFRMFAGK